MDLQKIDTEAYFKREFSALFAQGRAIAFSPPPYLKARVMARLPEQTIQATALRWKWITAFSSATALLAMLWISFTQRAPRADFVAQLGDVVTVRVAVNELEHLSIQRARVELEGDLRFYSQSLPEIEARRFLELAWNSQMIGSHLPILVSAASTGSKRVTIRFYDEKGQEVALKTLDVEFKKAVI
ncbi:MAG: hypothetical protein AB7P04_01270 [Bacteriovoracia bacterium]